MHCLLPRQRTAIGRVPDVAAAQEQEVHALVLALQRLPAGAAQRQVHGLVRGVQAAARDAVVPQLHLRACRGPLLKSCDPLWSSQCIRHDANVRTTTRSPSRDCTKTARLRSACGMRCFPMPAACTGSIVSLAERTWLRSGLHMHRLDPNVPRSATALPPALAYTHDDSAAAISKARHGQLHVTPLHP